MTKQLELDKIKKLVEECIKNDKLDFLCNLIYILQTNYKDLAMLCTDDKYNDSWTHTKILEYFTYELN
jgi:hypothetical protein